MFDLSKDFKKNNNFVRTKKYININMSTLSTLFLEIKKKKKSDQKKKKITFSFFLKKKCVDNVDMLMYIFFDHFSLFFFLKKLKKHVDNVDMLMYIF
jgi:hypothetical protein